ncbi:MAG: hypothetical protein ACK4TF_02660 [Thermodesulfovibrionales bacterium]
MKKVFGVSNIYYGGNKMALQESEKTHYEQKIKALESEIESLKRQLASSGKEVGQPTGKKLNINTVVTLIRLYHLLPALLIIILIITGVIYSIGYFMGQPRWAMIGTALGLGIAAIIFILLILAAIVYPIIIAFSPNYIKTVITSTRLFDVEKLFKLR